MMTVRLIGAHVALWRVSGVGDEDSSQRELGWEMQFQALLLKVGLSGFAL